MTLDPAALQVLISRLTGVAEEMGAVLRRAAFSPNIKERADCSAALFTADGEMLVQAEHIPVHLGSMPASVRAAIDAFGDDIRPGEQVVLNDPFAGGTHLNDITLVAPCRVDGRLVGWAANRAHHADVGGAAPGSIPADATEIHQEGLRIPPTLLDDGLRRLLLANSRTPDERVGDLDAQEGANVVGVERLAALADAPAAPRSSTTASAGCGPRSPACPTGRGGSTDVLDSTGAAPDQQRPARIAVARHGGGRRGDRSTSPAPTRRRGATSTRSRPSPCRPWRTPCGRPSTPPSPPTAAPCGPVRVAGAAGHDRGGPAAGGRGGGQRRGEPAGGRRVPRRRWPGRARTGCRPPARGR